MARLVRPLRRGRQGGIASGLEYPAMPTTALPPHGSLPEARRPSGRPARGHARRPGLAGLLVAVLLLSVAATTVSPPAVADFLKIDTAQEISIGREAASRFESKNRVVDHGPQAERIRRLGMKIAQASGRDLPYTFKVVDASTINAITFPGGFIYFYRGLLDQGLDDNQVACVLAHEVAHAVKSHTYKTLFVLGSIRKMSGQARENAVAQVLTAVTVQAPMSRHLEIEADRIGATIAYNAGFDPQGLVDVLELFQRLSRKNPSLTDKLMRTHPAPEDRIRKLQAVIQQLKSKGH